MRPLYKELIDYVELTMVPGFWSEPELLEFSYTMTSMEADEINFKINFDKPFEVSQNIDPERIIVVLNLYNI